MITGVRVWLASGCTATLVLFSRQPGDILDLEYTSDEYTTYPATAIHQVGRDANSLSDSLCTVPPVAPAYPPDPGLQSENWQLSSTVWNQTDSQYEQQQRLYNLNEGPLTVTNDQIWDRFLLPPLQNMAKALQGIEGLLHSKYPVSEVTASLTCTSGDNQFDIPVSSGKALNPIGALTSVTLRGKGAFQTPANRLAQNAPDTGNFGWIAAIHQCGGGLSGITMFGPRQEIYVGLQIHKFTQI